MTLRDFNLPRPHAGAMGSRYCVRIARKAAQHRIHLVFVLIIRLSIYYWSSLFIVRHSFSPSSRVSRKATVDIPVPLP
jgi:hypothetical protein